MAEELELKIKCLKIKGDNRNKAIINYSKISGKDYQSARDKEVRNCSMKTKRCRMKIYILI